MEEQEDTRDVVIALLSVAVLAVIASESFRNYIKASVGGGLAGLGGLLLKNSYWPKGGPNGKTH